MHSLGDVRKTKPLNVVSVEYRDATFDWIIQFERDGFTWFKIVSIEIFMSAHSFKQFLNDLITEVKNG